MLSLRASFTVYGHFDRDSGGGQTSRSSVSYTSVIVKWLRLRARDHDEGTTSGIGVTGPFFKLLDSVMVFRRWIVCGGALGKQRERDRPLSTFIASKWKKLNLRIRK